MSADRADHRGADRSHDRSDNTSHDPRGHPRDDQIDDRTVGEGDAVVDARGLRCPLPVIRLARLVRDDPSVGHITVLATDPAAAHDIPAWCRMRGHRYVGAARLPDHTAYEIEVTGLKPTAAAEAPSAPP